MLVHEKLFVSGVKPRMEEWMEERREGQTDAFMLSSVTVCSESAVDGDANDADDDDDDDGI